MRQRIGSIGIITLLLVTILAGCGSSSDSAPTATIVVTENVAPTATTVAMTDNVEPPGDAPADIVIPTNPPDDEVMPTSTLYVIGEPTPTALTATQCSYDNPARLEFLDFEEHRAELHACNELVQWPPGYEIDVEKLAYYGGNNLSGGAVGGARVIVFLQNACAWGTYWMDSMQAGDQEAADEALVYMGDTLVYFTIEGPPGPATADSDLQEIVSKAQLGDPSGMQWLLTWLDCQGYPEVRANP